MKSAHSCEEIRAALEAEGYKVTQYPFRDFASIPAICSNSHSCLVNWYSFKKGCRCQECRRERVRRQEGVLPGKKMIPFEVVKEEIERTDYRLITTLSQYRGVGNYIEIKCPQNHFYKTKFGEFRKGKRCRKCRVLNTRGENHPMWNKDLSDEERFLRRDSRQHEEWRNKVLERDRWVCICCQGRTSKDNPLCAHHLENYKGFPELRFEVENGVTLCKECHKRFHGVYGLRGTRLTQFIEFSQTEGFDFDPENALTFKEYVPTSQPAQTKRSKVLEIVKNSDRPLTVRQVNAALGLDDKEMLYTRQILTEACQSGLLNRCRLPLETCKDRKFHFFLRDVTL